MARSRGSLGVRARLHGGARPLARLVLHGSRGGEGGRVRRLLFALTTLALIAPANAFARGEFDPSIEFEQHEWIPIHLGPLDLSVTKAVVYLWLGAGLTMLLGLVLMRGKTLNRRQTVGEQIYEIAQTTFVFTHFEGIRENGPGRYFKSWIPEVPKAILPLIIPLEILGQFMRLISLSVRLYANMLAGHMLILTFLGLIFVLESIVLAVVVVPAATAFYLFEVVIVVSIQAFIFAALSAIYIGSAIEPEH